MKKTRLITWMCIFAANLLVGSEWIAANKNYDNWEWALFVFSATSIMLGYQSIMRTLDV